MESQDIRWIQRFDHFRKAFSQLDEAVKLSKTRPLSRLEEQGLIHSFEYTYELAWNTLKDYLETQGETTIHGSRDAIRLSFQRGIIDDGETWMDMIKDQTLTVHTYNETTAREVVNSITHRYAPAFEKLAHYLETLREKYV